MLTLTTVAAVPLWQWVEELQLPQDKRATAMLDVLKLATSIAVGGGGLFALYLAARRQRTQELELAQRERVQAHAEQVAETARLHAERVADATERDAAERQITELYTKASDQLGSDKAAVRLAGLYALERLGQTRPEQQEAIGNLLCAYLRMPHPSPHPPPEDAAADQREAHELAQAQYDQERETRQTALDILTRHHPIHPQPEQRWPKLMIRLQRADLTYANLNGAYLSGAYLSGANLSGAYLNDANLSGAYLIDANLAGAKLTRANLTRASLVFAKLTNANLTSADLTAAELRGANFVSANLTCANLTNANLTEANPTGGSSTRANLSGANLNGANFNGANFSGAYLSGVNLNRVIYNENTVMTGAILDEETRGVWW